MGKLSQLKRLNLYSNRLDGKPSFLQTVVDYCMLGMIPLNIGNLSQLKQLFIYDNALTGTTPTN